MFSLFNIINKLVIFSRFFKKNSSSSVRDIVLTSDIHADEIYELTKTRFKAKYTIKQLFFSKKVASISLNNIYIGYINLDFLKKDETIDYILISSGNDFKATVFIQYEFNS